MSTPVAIYVRFFTAIHKGIKARERLERMLIRDDEQKGPGERPDPEGLADFIKDKPPLLRSAYAKLFAPMQ